MALDPKVQTIADAVAAVYKQALADAFVGLVLHGSGVKGEPIPNCSDLDFLLFVKDDVIDQNQRLPLVTCMAIQRDLCHVPLAPFRYIQCEVLGSMTPEGFIGPIPGAYALLDGDLPVSEATASQLLTASRRRLRSIDPEPGWLRGNLIEHGGSTMPGEVGARLSEAIRLMCTVITPTLYAAASLHEPEDVLALWTQPRSRVIETLSDDLGTAADRFYTIAHSYYPDESSSQAALALIEAGVVFLNAVQNWWIARTK